MKYVAKIMIVFLLVVSVCPVTFAQDNVSRIIEGNQDYLILGTVVNINDTTVEVAHYQTIYIDRAFNNPIANNENIEIDKFVYSYCDEHSDISVTPRVGDNIFVSINKNGSKYVVANGAYKVSSVDHKMLTFYASPSMKNKDCLADLVALAYFVRSNGVRRDFEFVDGSLTMNAEGKKIALYPTENITDTITFVDGDGKVVEAAVAGDVIIDGENNPSDKNTDDFRWAFACCFILISLFVGGVAIYKFNDITIKKKDADNGGQD